MRKLFLFLLSATLVFGQGGRPPVDKYADLRDVDVTGLAVSNIMVWNGTVWVPSSTSSGAGLPPIAGHGGQFLTTDATSIFWGTVPFASLSSKPTTAVGYGIAGGTNLDVWGTKTPYAGSLTIASGKTVSFPNTFSIVATDGATLNIGAGGTLGSNAFSSTAFVLQTTTVNGHALSGNVTVTKSDLGLGYLLSGAGSPEGAISAPVGSQYARTDGGVGTSFYVKQSGTGNTGWTAGAGGGSLPTGGTVGQVLVKNSSTDFDSSWAVDPGGVGGGGGTVLDVGVTTANGVSATTLNATDHPRMTFSLGAITPSSVAATGTVTGTNISGTNTGDQTITLTGPVTGSGTGSFATTIADGAVGLAKIAGIPAGTMLGNNTAGITSPIALTPTQAKTVLGLGNVENTALSTWTGSTSITTVGNLTGNPPTSSVAYSLLPVGSATNTVAAGNDPRLAASVTGIRKGTGNAVNDVAATTNVDYAQNSEGGFTNAGGPGPLPTPQPWTAGKVVMSEITTPPGITADRYSLLPAANAYAPGTIITYIDAKTTGNFGRNFRPAAGGDTLDGLTNAQMATAGTWLKPFIAGASDIGKGTYQWKTDGATAWTSIYANGHAIKLQDPLDATITATFDVSNIPPTNNRTIHIAPSDDSGTAISLPKNTVIAPTAPLQFIDSYNSATGLFGSDPVHVYDLVPTQHDVNGVPSTPGAIVGNANTVPSNGQIDSVRLSASLTAPLTLVWPSASLYSAGETVRFYDASGSISTTNTVIVTANSNGAGPADLINGASTQTISEQYAARAFVADPASNSWTLSQNNSNTIANSGKLSENTSTHTLSWPIVTGVNYQTAVATPTGNDNITFTGGSPVAGMKFELIVVQPPSGGPVNITLPSGSLTPAGGAGVLHLSTGANVVDKIVGTYYGLTGSTTIAWVWDVQNNYTGATSVTCTGGPEVYGSWLATGNTLHVGAANATKWLSTGNFTPTAGNNVICKISAAIYKGGAGGAPTGDLTMKVYLNNGTVPNAGAPGTLVGTSAIVTAGSITNNTEALALSNPVDFIFTPAITLSTSSTYHVAVGSTAFSSTNFYSWVVQASQGAPYANYSTSDPVSVPWAAFSGNSKAFFKTWH